MNKVILRIALLGFFVATAIFGMGSMPLPDVLIYALAVSLSIMISAVVIVGIRRVSNPGKPYQRVIHSRPERTAPVPEVSKTQYPVKSHLRSYPRHTYQFVARERMIVIRVNRR